MAVRNVSSSCGAATMHAVLGPNGAGKITLINLLSGDLPADRRDASCTAARHHPAQPRTVARASGIGRSYQKTNIFPPFTAFENCRLAAQSRTAARVALFERRGPRPASARGRRAALDAAGLGARAGVIASTLSHGEQRQLEIAMVLATAPKVLLLDEPLAGMGAEESLRMVALLKRLAPDHAMLLVEHDMDAVFAVADWHDGDGERRGAGERHARRRSAPAPPCRQAYLGRGTPARPRDLSEPLARAPRGSTPTTGRATSCTGSTSASGAARRSASWAATAWARPRCCKAMLGLVQAAAGEVLGAAARG